MAGEEGFPQVQPQPGVGGGNRTPSPDSLVTCSTGAVGSSGTDGPPPLVTERELCPLPLSGLTLAPTTSGKHQTRSNARGRRKVAICPDLSELTQLCRESEFGFPAPGTSL